MEASPTDTNSTYPPIVTVSTIRPRQSRVSFIIIGVVTLLLIAAWLVAVLIMDLKKTGLFKPYSPPALSNGAQPGGAAVAQSADIVAVKEAALCNAYKLNTKTIPNPSNPTQNITVPLTIPAGLTCP